MCCCCLMISIKEETRYLFSELWSWRDWYSCGSGYRNCSIGRWQGRPWSGAGMCAMRSECSGSQSRVKLEFTLEVVALRSWPLEPSRWHCMLESYFINYEINMPLPGTRNPMYSFLWNGAGCDTLRTPPPKLSLPWRRTLSLCMVNIFHKIDLSIRRELGGFFSLVWNLRLNEVPKSLEPRSNLYSSIMSIIRASSGVLGGTVGWASNSWF